MELSTLKVLCTTIILHNLKVASSWFLGCDECQPCESSTTVETCIYPTTQATVNSQSPIHVTSKSILDNTTVYSAGSIVGAAIGGAFFGFVVTATVFVYIRRGLCFCTRQRGKSNNPVFRLHDFNNDKISKQLGDDIVVYNEITDEMQFDESLQTMPNKEEYPKRDHMDELGKAGRTTIDDYDHTASAFTAVKGPQKGTHSVERCYKNTDDTDLAQSLQTSINQKELVQKENVPEHTDLETTSTDNQDISPTFTEDEHEMASKVEERDKILHKVKATTLSECSITTESEDLSSLKEKKFEA